MFFSQQRPIRQATWLLVASVVFTLVMIALIIFSLSHANRPHELRFVPLVSGLGVVNAVLCVRLIVMLLRAWRGRDVDALRWFHSLLIVLSIAQVSISMFLLTTALSELFGF